MNKMTWTTEKPTKDGWYWYKDRNFLTTMARIYDFEEDEIILVHIPEFKKRFEICDLNGEWAGPIPEPRESR